MERVLQCGHGSSTHVVRWANFFASRGYAFLNCNFRGSTGFGKTYLNAGDRQWGDKMNSDLVDAKREFVKLGVAHENKTVIFGGSYGGYAVLAALTFTPDEFTCGVDMFGPSNIISNMEDMAPYEIPRTGMYKKKVSMAKEL